MNSRNSASLLAIDSIVPAWRELITQAGQAKEKAIALLSGFRVGAALLTAEDRCYQGCNIENISLSLSICAERVAFLKALSEGEKRFKALAIVSDSPRVITPCGACRQLIWEFAPDITIIMDNPQGDVQWARIGDLLPQAFYYLNSSRP
ncbi:MAG: cytidine deaminase [bacterium]